MMTRCLFLYQVWRPAVALCEASHLPQMHFTIFLSQEEWKKKVLSIYTRIADRTHEHGKKNKRTEGKVDRVG